LPASLPGRLAFTITRLIIKLPNVQLHVLPQGQSGKSGDESVGLNIARPHSRHKKAAVVAQRVAVLRRATLLSLADEVME
jgi:hypothetical protein